MTALVARIRFSGSAVHRGMSLAVRIALLVLIFIATSRSSESLSVIQGRLIVRKNPDGSIKSATIISIDDSIRYRISKSEIRDQLSVHSGSTVMVSGTVRRNEKGTYYVRVKSWEVVEGPPVSASSKKKKASTTAGSAMGSEEDPDELTLSRREKSTIASTASGKKKKKVSLRLRLAAAAAYDNNIYTFGEALLKALAIDSVRRPFYNAGMRSTEDWYLPVRSRLQFTAAKFRAAAGVKAYLHLHNRPMDSFGLTASAGYMGNMYLGAGYAFDPYSPSRLYAGFGDTAVMLWSKNHKFTLDWYLRKTTIKPGIWLSYTDYDYCPSYNSLDGKNLGASVGLRGAFGILNFFDRAGAEWYLAADSLKNAEYWALTNNLDLALSPKPWSLGVGVDLEYRNYTTANPRNSNKGRIELRGSLDPFVTYTWRSITGKIGFTHSFRQTWGMSQTRNEQRTYGATGMSAGITWDLDIM